MPVYFHYKIISDQNNNFKKMKIIYKIKIIFICLIVISNCSSFIQEKIPEYLGIVTDSNRSRPLVYEFILRAMNILVHNNLDDPDIVEDYLSIMLNNTLIWKEPDSWHTTCLYIGDNIEKLYSHREIFNLPSFQHYGN